MTVHKDPNTNKWFYSVRVENVHGEKVHKKKRGFDKKKDALIAQQKFLETYDTEIEAQYTFREIAERFMQYSNGRKKETTIYNQNNLINHILIPHFKTTPIKNIKPKHIDDFYQSIFDNYSNSMLANIRRNLSAIFNFAVNFYNLSRNLVKVVSLPKHEERRKQEYWTIDEFNHFINVVDNIVYKTLFMVLFWSGARKGEILAYVIVMWILKMKKSK
ncbi:Arm DNA-binding domain-containing protein [Staphylococcus arlettae]|uniref:Arm DNA-binding domain-containing protein n=1 Tax=Staphylococcus arlettae TaxID=29378 RepID=UPI00030EA907|nr:Arm DNA-binding domain-containing protein [Staphylococcus arlettae]